MPCNQKESYTVLILFMYFSEYLFTTGTAERLPSLNIRSSVAARRRWDAGFLCLKGQQFDSLAWLRKIRVWEVKQNHPLFLSYWQLFPWVRHLHPTVAPEEPPAMKMDWAIQYVHEMWWRGARLLIWLLCYCSSYKKKKLRKLFQKASKLRNLGFRLQYLPPKHQMLVKIYLWWETTTLGTWNVNIWMPVWHVGMGNMVKIISITILSLSLYITVCKVT